MVKKMLCTCDTLKMDVGRITEESGCLHTLLVNFADASDCPVAKLDPGLDGPLASTCLGTLHWLHPVGNPMGHVWAFRESSDSFQY